MTLGAGLVLSGCGDDDTATTPAPAPPPPPPPAPEPEPEPEPEPPAPEAPATPTGLHADTTETSIEWHWNAVEGAIGYVVQVSPDEMFDDNDPQVPTVETHYTVADLEPGTTMYGRVRAAAGTLEAPLLSDWTTHVTGTSDVPVPTPPPPAPAVMAMFSLADDAKKSYFMVPDTDDDAASAMAWVNPEIMVESNSSAIITPMFIDDANGVSVDMGMNMPFAFVGAEGNWDMLQSMVLSDGATFMVQRTTVGANQEMEPTGDVAYVTCGPFECTESMMEVPAAPDISIENSAACEGWDPTVDIQVGKVDNDVVAPDDGEDDTDGVATNDGIDLGIVTSSTLEMTVKHVFSGVPNGTNTSGTTTAASGSNKTLTMKDIGSAIQAFKDADSDDALTEDVVPCDNDYDTGDITDWPGGSNKGCFRLRVVGSGSSAANYLSGYSLELSPKDAGVTWGNVDWDPNPFKDLKCDSMTMMVSDEVDVCAMFEDEVDYALRGKGWQPEVLFTFDVGGTAAADHLSMWRATPEKASDGGKNFKTLWFDDNLNGKIEKDGSPSRERPEATTGVAAGAMHDLYNQNQSDPNLEHIWEWLTDVDEDPNAGDLGKVDMVSDANDSDYDSATDDSKLTVAVENGSGSKTWPDGMADNYLSDSDQADVRKCTEDDGGESHNGTICDAVWTRDASVLFADGTFGCTTTRDVTITCTWDADGGLAVGRNALPSEFTAASQAHFLDCVAK